MVWDVCRIILVWRRLDADFLDVGVHIVLEALRSFIPMADVRSRFIAQDECSIFDIVQSSQDDSPLAG